MDKRDVRVLVVDDEEGIVKALQLHLEMQGYTVETAGSGPEALAALERHRYDVVLSDIMMAEMDGVELLMRIKEKHGDTIVVMITAADSLAKVLSCRLYGAADYLLKPFDDLDAVTAVVDRAYQKLQRWEEVMNNVRTLRVR
ncbi:MAG TPA: response regulator [Candidatus Krumholzibacteria bacterium]|nr:response regulator [Candidatus Krumholzibacteria bacterium]HPD70519.1 response regulator [Candidatus Krumholzibacteria bacterium]HRY39781.1 response regulator [Candidatus Krumholzibacteria bacterium]